MIALRYSGGVWIRLMSRTPVSDMCKVRGIGVAVSASTSTVERRRLSFSLCRTPKRCSSSSTSSPRSLKATSFWIRRWVPITMSTAPDFKPFRMDCCSLRERKRLRQEMFTG